MNLPDCPDSMQTVFYMIDPKTLQLKWTDIEIRKHVIPQMQQEQNNNEEVEDDLPPLEQPATEIDSDRKAPSPERVEPEESNTNHTEEAEEENEEELKTQIKSTIEKITDMHQTKEAKKKQKVLPSSPTVTMTKSLLLPVLAQEPRGHLQSRILFSTRSIQI